MPSKYLWISYCSSLVYENCKEKKVLLYRCLYFDRFLYDEASQAHQYFKYKVVELRAQAADGNDADSEDLDGM